MHSLWLLGEAEVKQVFGGADRDFILPRHRQTLLDCQVETESKEMGSRNSESSEGGGLGIKYRYGWCSDLGADWLDSGERTLVREGHQGESANGPSF